MLDLELCRELLGLPAPWQVVKVTVDQSAKRLDVHLGFGVAPKRTMFSFSLKKGALGTGGQRRCPHCHTEIPREEEIKRVPVRHLPAAGFSTYLHVPSPGTVQSNRFDCICMKSWVAPGTRCTEAMRDHVLALLQTVSDGRTVARLAGIAEDELQEIKKLDGTTSAAGTGNISPPLASPGVPGVPGTDHPVWQQIINGDQPLQTKFVALNMLLERVRGNYAASPSLDTVMAGTELLRQFFIRNRKLLSWEIDQLKHPGAGTAPKTREAAAGGSESPTEATESLSIPAQGDSIWYQLINGDRSLHTGMVALNMLLQRVRLDYSKSPNVETSEAGAALLRQFFIRNRRLLAGEIDQLGSRSPGTGIMGGQGKPAGIDDGLPAESAPVWQQLASGELRLETRMVGLQMILERVRKSSLQDRSPAARQAAIRILREFFIKHRGRLGREIAQLGGGSESAPLR